MTKTAVIFEPTHTGHHLRYVAILVEAFHRRGYRVRLVSFPGTFVSCEYRAFLHAREALFTPVIVPGTDCRGIFGRLRKTLWLWRVLRRERATIVFVPYADPVFFVFGGLGIAAAFAGVRPRGLQCILMGADFAHIRRPAPFSRMVKDLLCREIIRFGPFQRIFLIEEVAFESLRERTASPRVCLAPDPVDRPYASPAVDIRGRYGLPQEARILGAFGVLSPAKGVDRLVDAFLERGPGANEYLLLMGQQKPETRVAISRIASARGGLRNVVVIDRFVSEAELDAALRSVNVVAVTYPYHLVSASFLIRAAAAGKPVLGSRVGWIGHVMARYRLGRTCNPLDRTDMIAGIDWAFDCPHRDCEDAAQFAGLHSVAAFEQAVCGDLD
jgi:glycosyltransferase involved in cell wall biosynthesis